MLSDPVQLTTASTVRLFSPLRVISHRIGRPLLYVAQFPAPYFQSAFLLHFLQSIVTFRWNSMTGNIPYAAQPAHKFLFFRYRQSVPYVLCIGRSESITPRQFSRPGNVPRMALNIRRMFFSL